MRDKSSVPLSRSRFEKRIFEANTRHRSLWRVFASKIVGRSSWNGEGADPLFAYLQQQKGFEGFDEGHGPTPILDDLLGKADPGYASKPDIKWNFTKFFVDRNGAVVRRFEPTTSIPDVVAPAVEELL